MIRVGKGSNSGGWWMGAAMWVGRSSIAQKPSFPPISHLPKFRVTTQPSDHPTYGYPDYPVESLSNDGEL